MANLFQAFRGSLLCSPLVLGMAQGAIALEAPLANDLDRVSEPQADVELETEVQLTPFTPLPVSPLSSELQDSSILEPARLEQPLEPASLSDPVLSLDQINQDTSDRNLGQVTSISQLRDVQPTDWAFQALQSLVERYGCIAGYPDGTFRGNRALTRYEFAAGLNACLDRITEILAIATEGGVTREDLLVLQRLQEEFAAELATLRGRVDALEARTAELEANQFSTTTKLAGEIVWSLESAFGDRKPNSNEDVDDNITLSGRARLNFDTSFGGRDRLRTRLQAANMPSLRDATGTRMAERNIGSSGDNSFNLNKLWYFFPVGDKVILHIATHGLGVDDILDATSASPYVIDALSLFTSFNNLIYSASPAGGAGFGANVRFTDSIGIDLGYFTSDAPFPEAGEGLFNGQYAAAAQLNLGLGEAFDLALSYVRTFQNGDDGYDLSGFVGSERAADPFNGRANSTNNFGVQANWRLSRRFNVGGYVGYSSAQTEAQGSGEADIWNWAVNVALPDLGREGSVFLVGFGMPPKLTGSSGRNVRNEDPDTSYLLNVEYRFPITENINITPGAYVIFNPEHNRNNDTIYVGMIRTIFSF